MMNVRRWQWMISLKKAMEWYALHAKYLFLWLYPFVNSIILMIFECFQNRSWSWNVKDAIFWFVLCVKQNYVGQLKVDSRIQFLFQIYSKANCFLSIVRISGSRWGPLGRGKIFFYICELEMIIIHWKINNILIF